MASDYQKLSNDRTAQNIKRAVGDAVGALVTGNITKGSVVTVEIGDAATPSDTGTARVSSRRTGAFPISFDMNGVREYKWSIEGTTLTVTLNTSDFGTIDFWVF